MEFDTSASCPLDGVRVLDLSRLVAGNMVTHALADFGADVVKIESPGSGDVLRDWGAGGIPIQWKIYARNKRSLALDLKRPEGRELLLRLVADAQVLVENFRPGALEGMGLGPDVLHTRNPGLVIVRISGFGQTGPYASRPGFGTLIEAMSGFAEKTGFPDRPPSLPNMALADMVAGVYGAYAVMVALREVEVKRGTGQVIDLSLLEPLHSILGGDAAAHAATGRAPTRSGNRSNTASPRNTYRTSDGRWLAISGSMQVMAMRLFRAIGRGDMCDDPRFSTNAARVRHADLVDEAVQDAVGRMTLDEAVAFFERHEVTAGPIYDAGALREDRHVKERGVIVELPDADMGRIPMHAVVPRLSGTPGAIRRPAPALGQDTDDVLHELGLSDEEVAALREDGIVR